MRVMVTGSSGFIGRHVCRALVESGHEVDPWDMTHGKDLRRVALDVSNCETIVHLAAFGGVARASKEPRALVTNNVDATMALVETAQASRCGPRVIHVSSFSVYGHQGANVTDITEPCPSELYGASKYMQELCWAAYPATILRLASVYGRGMPKTGDDMTIVARIAEWIRRGEPPILFEDGKQTRDWVYVGDVCDAIVRLIGGSDAPSMLNVCSGSSWSLLEACDMVAATMGRPCRPRVTREKRKGDMRHCRGNASQFMMLLGRIPTQFPEGVKLAFGP